MLTLFYADLVADMALRWPVLTHLAGAVRWANEGRQVWRGDTIVDPPKVHPYSSVWGKLLDKEKRYEVQSDATT